MDVSMKIGARNSANDAKRIQALHDLTCELGATCGAPPADETPVEDKNITVPAYIKSLHLTIPDEQFRDVMAAKFVGRDEIRGYVALWGDPNTVDLESEFFTKQTDFWDSVLGLPRPLTWNHAQDKSTFKNAGTVGQIISFGDDEVGRFYNAVLDRSNKYRAAVDKLIEQRKIGTSSDSAPQYVEREKMANGSVWLKTWPLFAAALTDVPCEPRMLDIGLDFWKAIGVDAKLLASRIAEAGLEVSRDEMKQRLASAERRARELQLYA